MRSGLLTAAVVLGISLVVPPSSGYAQQSELPAPALYILPGVAKPGRDVTLSFYIEGTVASLADEGTRVAAGDAIATLEDHVARASLRIATIEAGMTGEIDLAQSRHAQAQRSHDRLLHSGQQGAANEYEIEQSEAELEQAAAMLRSALSNRDVKKATVELRQATLDDHTMEAPFDGIILRVDSEVGLAVREATPLIRLVELSTLKVDMHLPIELYGMMDDTVFYQLELGSPSDTVVNASLRWSEPIVDPATSTFRAVFEIDNADGSIPSGVTVRLTDQVIASLLERKSIAQNDSRIASEAVDLD